MPELFATPSQTRDRLRRVLWRTLREWVQVGGDEQEKEEVWERLRHRVRRAFGRSVRIAFREGLHKGARQPRRLLPDERKFCQKMARSQTHFFLNLLRDAREGTYRMSPDARIPMYLAALDASYWAGFVLSNLSAGRFLRWRLGRDEWGRPVEHCADCVALARGGRWRRGVYSARELARKGVFPRSGHLCCVTHCKCRLVVLSPSQKAAYKERYFLARKRGGKKGVRLAHISLQGPRSNSFRGQGREQRTKLERVAHGAASHRWSGRILVIKRRRG